MSAALAFVFQMLAVAAVESARRGQGDILFHFYDPFSLSWGNRITSRIDCWLVSSITRRSMPMPSPPVGGIPYSSARR